MGKKSEFIKGLIAGDLRVAEFAITNICTAKCQFCSIWAQKEKHTVDTEKGVQVVRNLKKLGVRFLTITGGEPLLHPGFAEIASACAGENIITTTITADPRVLTDKRIGILKDSAIDIMGISIDHHTEEGIMKSRKIPGAIAGMKTALSKMKKLKIGTTACVLISDFNHDCLDTLFAKCEELGFDSISVNYPVFSPSPTYTLGGDAIKLSKAGLVTALREVIDLKKKYNIANPAVSMENIILFLEGKKVRFPCLGGYRSFFVDWTFDVYPCMCHERKLGNIFTMKKSDIKKLPCNLCNMSWYRDFSIYFQGFKSIVPLLSEMKRVAAFKT